MISQKRILKHVPGQFLNTVTFSQIGRNLTLIETGCKFDNEINNPQMSSIIEGYNYDIFISYRQMDNN
jgi:hypothetical protein